MDYHKRIGSDVDKISGGLLREKSFQLSVRDGALVLITSRLTPQDREVRKLCYTLLNFKQVMLYGMSGPDEADIRPDIW